MAHSESLGRGFKFSDGAWHAASAKADAPPAHPSASLRVATLNVLTSNGGGDAYLHHATRFDHIVNKLLPEIDADVIGLNEVTAPLLRRLQEAAWVRKSYILSYTLDADVADVLTAAFADRSGGSVLLSRIAPVRCEYIKTTPSTRYFPVLTLQLGAGGLTTTVAVASVHLKAFPWYYESTRREELRQTTALLEDPARGVDASIIMGDHNFHREEENASIPTGTGWHEMPAVVALGNTWDLAANMMLPHYLPLRNIYNGFGLLPGWADAMRLDRMLVRKSPKEKKGKGENCCCFAFDAATARLFANEPVDDRAKGKARGLPGPELARTHRALPSHEYLFPSDHFGIVATIPLMHTVRG